MVEIPDGRITTAQALKMCEELARLANEAMSLEEEIFYIKLNPSLNFFDKKLLIRQCKRIRSKANQNKGNH